MNVRANMRTGMGVDGPSNCTYTAQRRFLDGVPPRIGHAGSLACPADSLTRPRTAGSVGCLRPKARVCTKWHRPKGFASKPIETGFAALLHNLVLGVKPSFVEHLGMQR